MDVNEYARRKQTILNRMIAGLVYVFRQFLTPFLTPVSWARFIRVMFRVIAQYREEATALAREFYDDNRAAQLPDEPRHDIFKDDNYREEFLRETMQPVYDNLKKTGNVEGAIQDSTNRAVKVIEDGARRTILRGVDSDTSQPIRGFARFDPRPPTCAFCTMMISRGPVYTRETGGFTGSKESATQLWRENDTDAMNEMMNRWHPGCTCIAVPVYKLSGYPTERQEEEALKIYIAARKRAQRKGDVSYKAILKEMRKDLYNPASEEDETNLTQSVA